MIKPILHEVDFGWPIGKINVKAQTPYDALKKAVKIALKENLTVDFCNSKVSNLPELDKEDFICVDIGTRGNPRIYYIDETQLTISFEYE